ncbi:MAG: DEAD/DEAH box helicase [Deltaproteobacteria bacterium]|nr:DEAD/DEAH box helicase [Deltaproteobacteria bacterium]
MTDTETTEAQAAPEQAPETPAAEAKAAPKKKTVRKKKTTKKKVAADGAGEAAAETTEKPKRRRKKKVAPKADDEAPAEASGEEKPKRRRKKVAKTDAEAGDEPKPKRKRKKKVAAKVAAKADENAPKADAKVSSDADAAPTGESNSNELVVKSDYDSARKFSEFPLSPEILQSISEHGYDTATGVQAATLEPALAGRCLVVRSKTGTGKTAAFCIPMVERIASGDRKARAIVLAPTRELARQVGAECEALCKYKDIAVAVIYGGVGFGPQEQALKAGAEIVVGTPGRILDHIRRGNLDLSEASFATLDEADEMLSMGFYEDVRKILDQTPDARQCLFFSATVDDRVRALITRYAKDPLDIRLSTDTDKVEGITHIAYETSPNFHKARALLAIIDQEEPSSAIIFCNTREDTATVATYLARQGLDAELISGELPQGKREQVMTRVKAGETQFLVATDVAARGIDISDLSHVVNYSLPEDPAVYMHRTGRTGRIGKKGIAISLVSGPDFNTRETLTKRFEINFEERPLPTAEEAAAARVERQAKVIREATKTMAFEGYLGTVRALKNRPDGDVLLAAALRGFFMWERQRRVATSSADSVGALQEAREEKQARRGDRRGGDRRGRGDHRGGNRNKRRRRRRD